MKIEKVFKVRNRFDRMRRTVQLAVPPEKSLTQQQFKDECDMNRIVKNAMKGIAPRYLARGVPQYGDFSEVPDLREAYEVIEKAEEAFFALPAELRRELGNDPREIQNLTADQVARYKLGKEQPTTGGSEAEPSPSPASSAPKAPSEPKQKAKAGTPPPEE